MSIAQVTIRKVLASDREDILEISRQIWGGHDYLPSVFDEWLMDAKCYTYGVEADDRVVAVGNLRLVERGKTGWMEGLRVHPEYRKRGFARMLTQHLVDLGDSLGVQRLRFTTGSNNRASLKLAKEAGFARIFKMRVLWYQNINTSSTSKLIHSSMKEFSPKKIYNLSRSNPSLIPCNVLVYDWKALDSTLQGFKEIGKTYSFYALEKKGKPESLSFGYIRPEHDNGSWSFTLYASDTESFLSQFFNHVTIASNKGLASIVCTIKPEFEKALQNSEWALKPAYKLHVILLEKTMEKNPNQKKNRHK